MATQERQSSKDAWAKQRQIDARQVFLNSQVAAQWLDLEKYIAWHDKLVLDQVICKKVDEGWLVILKAPGRRGPLASFILAGSLIEAFEMAGEWASRGVLTWVEDKWPPKARKQFLP